MKTLLALYAPDMDYERKLVLKLYDLELEDKLILMLDKNRAFQISLIKLSKEKLVEQAGLEATTADQLLKEIYIGLGCADNTANQADKKHEEHQDYNEHQEHEEYDKTVKRQVARSGRKRRKNTSKNKLKIALTVYLCLVAIVILMNVVHFSFVISYNGEYVFWGEIADYQRAAKQGDVEAQVKMANYFFRGAPGLIPNKEKAVYWYEQAVEQGNPVAQNNLAFCYLHGQGVSQDKEKAISLYMQSAEQGYALAQTSLGYCYQTGQGVAVDIKQAKYWYQKSAEQGELNAIKLLKELE